MASVAAVYEEKVSGVKERMEHHAASVAALHEQAAAAKRGAVEVKQEHRKEAARLEQQLEEVKAKLAAMATERDHLAKQRGKFELEGASLQARLRLDGEAAEGAAAESRDPKTLRKADLLSLQTALEGAQSLAAVAETEAKARREEARGAVQETSALAAQLSGVASANEGLLEARERLAAQSAEHTKLNAAMTERVRSLEAAAALARASEQRQEEQLQETRDQLRDAQMEVHSLARDTERLRVRANEKEEALAALHTDVAATRLKLDGAASEAQLREGELAAARREQQAASQRAQGGAAYVAQLEGQVQTAQAALRLARDEGLRAVQAKARAETLARQLRATLEELRQPKSPGGGVEAPPGDVDRAAGGALPKVPVLGLFTESLAEATREINVLAEVTLKEMSKVEPLNISDVIGPDDADSDMRAAPAPPAEPPAPARGLTEEAPELT